MFGLPSNIYMWITANQNAPCLFLCAQSFSLADETVVLYLKVHYRDTPGDNSSCVIYACDIFRHFPKADAQT